jgi:FkbM family methyltransferase
MKPGILKAFLFVFSRPIFFSFFYRLNKVCLVAMNRTSAAQFTPEFSGEKTVFEFVLQKLNTSEKLVFFDCGGNLGHYSTTLVNVCNLKKTIFDLYIFEPSSICHNALQEKFGTIENIQLHKLAISELNDTAKLYFPWQGAGGASLSQDVSDFQVNSNFEIEYENVNIIKLDDFCTDHNIQKIDFLKLDIEGFELLALKGAAKMIADKNIKFI